MNEKVKMDGNVNNGQQGKGKKDTYTVSQALTGFNKIFGGL